MKKPRITLVRLRDGLVWHLQVGTDAVCGAKFKVSVSISGEGTPHEVIECTREPKLPLCPRCF